MFRSSAAVVVLLLGCSSSNSGPPIVASGGRTAAAGGGTAGDTTGGNGGAPQAGSAGAEKGGSGGSVTTGVKVTVAPKVSTVVAGRTLQLSATVTGSADTSVSWSIVENNCGSVSATGNYTAPASMPDPAYCHVRATSHADAGALDSATLTIVSSPVTGQTGVWENVTPTGISLDYNNPPTNFGLQFVVADPVRASDLYAGACYQGVWRSTDFGITWQKVSTGQNGAVLESGRPWSAVIDNNPNRDPSTAPALYVALGYGSQSGVFKSSDWGANWTQYFAGNDVYGLEIDPYDDRHLLAGRHEAPGIAESTDAGVTWRSVSTGSVGDSIFPHFIDTGSAATTRKTWFLMPDKTTGTSARTTDGGATFTPIGGFGHGHSSNQLLNAGGGTAYLPTSGAGVQRSTDSGASWLRAYGSNDYNYAAGVIGTLNRLYAWDSGANGSGIGDAHLYESPRAAGTPWTNIPSPAGMINGPNQAAVTFDGTHYVVVGGNWTAGIWRYVEP